MNSVIRALRAVGLAAAVLVLPCCRDEVGQGDELHQVTIRASLNLQKLEPNSGVFEPAISRDGRWVVFASSSNVITANDNNGRRDIFIKDRLTGIIENVTDPFVPPFVGSIAPDDCSNPQVSDDGNFIVFQSNGAWAPFFAPTGVYPHQCIWRYNRATATYERAFDAAGPPDGDLTNPSMSADGMKVAYLCDATDLIPPKGAGTNTQVYVWDFNSGTGTIVSRKAGAANTASNDRCSTPRISADGNFVAFDSNATDLSAVTAALLKPQMYRVVSTGSADALPVARDAAGTITDAESWFGNISADGRYIVFHSNDRQLVGLGGFGTIMVRKDFSAPNGTVDLVADPPAFFPIPVFPNGYPPSVSADGQMVAFNSRDGSLAGGVTLNHPQVMVREMLTGKVFFCSRHKDGTPSNLDCEAPRISGDGKWAIWSTIGSTLVDGDTNGVSDVYMRGPLR